MPALFKPYWNTLSRLSLVVAVVLLTALLAGLYFWYRSNYLTRVGVAESQPVPFSHAHHAGGAGLDCRYCHSSVEVSSFAGMPATKTCMTCHSQLWWDSPALEPVRKSFQTGKPLHWTRVMQEPGFVYFDHSIHIAKGVGCSTCHGRVDRMALTYRVRRLYMNECVGCHRDPTPYLRPKDKIFDMSWSAPPNQKEIGKKLLDEYKVRPAWALTNCSTCHR